MSQSDDMISRQSAIDAHCELCPDRGKCPDICPDVEVFRLIAPAQSECKPPIFVAEDRFIKNMFAVFPHCPKCNADIATGQCYCSICGQHIDWSEEDE